MTEEEFQKNYERLIEIENRINRGWRLSADLNWLMEEVRKYLEKEKYDDI